MLVLLQPQLQLLDEEHEPAAAKADMTNRSSNSSISRFSTVSTFFEFIAISLFTFLPFRSAISHSAPLVYFLLLEQKSLQFSHSKLSQ